MANETKKPRAVGALEQFQGEITASVRLAGENGLSIGMIIQSLMQAAGTCAGAAIDQLRDEQAAHAIVIRKLDEFRIGQKSKAPQ